MEIDNNTKANYISITLDHNEDYVKILKERAEDAGFEDNKLLITLDDHNFQTDEYYFDESDNSISITGNMESNNGETYISISIPLSDIILIDIIKYASKKLNKLKSALESLK